MNKLPDWLSHRGFWMALATLVILAVAAGIVLGSWIADTKETGAAIGGVIASFLGAAIAVTGAGWVQSAKEAREQKMALVIVTRIVEGVRMVASDLSDLNVITPMTDKVLQQAVFNLLAIREQLIHYRPYHQITDGDLPFSLMDIDMVASTFEAFTEDAKELPTEPAGHPLIRIRRTATPREKPQMMMNSIRLLHACNVCLKRLGQPMPDMTAYQKTEMRRVCGNLGN